MIVRELLTRLGFDADNKEAKQYEASLQKIVKVGAAAVAGAAALAGAAVLVARNFATGADQVERFARLSNAATDEFQRTAAGAKVFGIEQDKLADILKDTNDRVGDFIQTGGGPMADFFEKIAPKVGVTAKQFENLSGPQALQLFVSTLEQAGLNAQEMTFYMEAIASDSTLLIPLFQQNGKALKELGDAAAETGAILDKDALASAAALRREFGMLDTIMTGLRNTVAAAVLPMVRELIGGLREWFMQNRVIIRQNLQDFVEVLVSALRLLGGILKAVGNAVDSVAQFMGGWGNTIRLLTIALGLLTAVKLLVFLKEVAFGIVLVGKAVGGLTGLLKLLRAAMLAIPMIALVTAVALLVDELWNWYHGNQTIIGDLLGTWDEFRDKVVGVFDDAIAAITNFWSYLAQTPDRILSALPDGVLEFFGRGDLTTSGQQMATESAQASGAGLARSMMTQNSNVSVMLQVPMGTPEAQANFVKDVADQQIKRVLNETMRSAANNFTVAE